MENLVNFRWTRCRFKEFILTGLFDSVQQVVPKFGDVYNYNFYLCSVFVKPFSREHQILRN